MSDYPEELYTPIDTATGGFMVADTQPNFDTLPEGSVVAIYHFAGTATVKVRREALLMNDDGTIARSVPQK